MIASNRPSMLKVTPTWLLETAAHLITTRLSSSRHALLTPVGVVAPSRSANALAVRRPHSFAAAPLVRSCVIRSPCTDAPRRFHRANRSVAYLLARRKTSMPNGCRPSERLRDRERLVSYDDAI